MTLERFIERWTTPNYPPMLVSEQDLAKAEAELGVRFPTEYRAEVLRCGFPCPTLALLDSIVDNELNVADVSDFLDPISIVNTSRSWHEIGLPAHLIAFATDCMGNLFCFSCALPTSASNVFFFDHDEGSVHQVASSFTDWIDGLANLPASSQMSAFRRQD
ncbi:SMI1/KNR4 family protein [Sphingomonas sp. I4]